MWTNVQLTGSLAANSSNRWFTWGWPSAWQVVWYMMPTTPLNGQPSIGWDVEVERSDADNCTYWITVQNLTGQQIDFEGRYAVLG